MVKASCSSGKSVCVSKEETVGEGTQGQGREREPAGQATVGWTERESPQGGDQA